MPKTRALLTLSAALLMAACAGKPPEIVDGPVYPSVLQSSVVDIQVIRDGTKATLTNTTANTYTDARLWINQWFSHELPTFKPGDTLTLELAEFKDRYGNELRAGGFWAVDNPTKLVLMQIEQGDKLTGLIVIGQAE